MPSVRNDSLGHGTRTERFPETTDPSAWEPQELHRSEAWRHRFTDTELAELATSLEEIHRDELPGKPALPLLASQMAVTARELKSGLGFRILRGLPSADMTEREITGAFWVLSRLLGEPAEQPGGVRMAHVRTEPGSRDRLGFRAAGALPFHADPEDVIGFLCVKSSSKGGTRRLASAATVYNILAVEHPELLETLTMPFHVALTHPHPDHGHPWTRLPFLSLRDGVFNACAYPVHIRRAQKLAGVPELTETQSRALEVFDTVADKVAVSLELEPGDIEYFNNHVVLHSRTGFADQGSGRHLLRVWLSIAGFRPLDPNHPVRLKERMKGSDKG